MLAGRNGNFARYEIEKKFLLNELPNNLPKEFIDIHDTYLPESSLRLRIERSPEGNIIARKLTKKDKALDQGKYTNLMTSLYLSEKDLQALGKIEGSQLSKRRYIDQREDHRIVFDIFEGSLRGLILAEVEFTTHEGLNTFVSPDSSWKEVTEESKYSGGNLASKSV